MTPPRLVAVVALLLAVSLSACGGGSASASKSIARSPNAQKFCDTFKDASEKFGSDNSFPTKSQTGQVRAFADNVEKYAPDDILDAAKGLADFFRSVADGVDKSGPNPSPNPSVLAEFEAAFEQINQWAPTHCTT
jgi:hypothetical protein